MVWAHSCVYFLFGLKQLSLTVTSGSRPQMKQQTFGLAVEFSGVAIIYYKANNPNLQYADNSYVMQRE